MEDILKVSDFIPLGDNLIVRPIKLTEKSGFIRPMNEEDKSELGEVLASNVSYIKVGDTVLFNKYSSTKLDIGEELIVRADDVVAVLKKDK